MKNTSSHSKKNESKSQIVFNQYLREKRMHGFFELKVAEGKSFQFSAIEDNQYEGLQATEKNGLVWKLSDEDRRKKPCDTLCIPPLPSFLVIQFSKSFYLIRIAEIVKLKNAGQVSISLKKCKEIAEKVIHI